MVQRNELEAAQGGHTFPRRLRPSDLDLHGEGQPPIPLKPSKASRRESRLGFIHIFGRSSKPKEGDVFTPPKIESRSGGIRASIAELNYWPYGQQAKSEITLPTMNEGWELPVAMPEAKLQQRRPSNGGMKRNQGSASQRPGVATWTVPPLFKAYPQALKNSVLPAVNISAEALLRLNDKKNAFDVVGSLPQAGEANAGTDRDKMRRRNRGDSIAAETLPWTSKIYLLVTSGHLLQYAGEGAFDRLPEKVLRLGRSSAAFATDVIPGRHWVLQVSSDASADGQPSVESRSLFSKLQFRTQEKRQTSDLLMVFESAEDMEGWMAVLRGEIVKLGGKKSVSETGMPKIDENDAVLNEQPSQRTIVVKNPNRFSRILPSSPTFSLNSEREPRASDCSTTVTDFDVHAQDPSFDDVSTINSAVSQDGRQLESLRDSSYRLSYLSSGQRTVVTSTTSSPANSPVVDRFPLPGEAYAVSRDGSATPEARLRPNAGLIASRRMSLQTMGPFVGEAGLGDAMEAQPGSAPRGDKLFSPLGSHPPPNFSVPQTSSRRFSYVKVAEQEQSLPPTTREAGGTIVPRTSLRKLSNIRTVRPLSTVEDQPSPKENVIPERPVTSHHNEPRPSTPTEVDPQMSRGRLMSVPTLPSMSEPQPLPVRRSSLMPIRATPDVSILTQPRRLASLNALRTRATATPPPSLEATLFGPKADLQTPSPPPLPATPWADKIRRRRSSLDPMEGSRSLSPGFSRAAKRASIGSTLSDRSMSGEFRMAEIMETLPKRAPPPTGPLPPIPSRAPSTTTKQIITVVVPHKSLRSKRSLPQLAVQEGPPPAPPPTCALPSLPQRAL